MGWYKSKVVYHKKLVFKRILARLNMSNMAVQVEKSVIWEIERLEYSNTLYFLVTRVWHLCPTY